MTLRLMTPGRQSTFPIAERYTTDLQQAIDVAKAEARARGSAGVTVSDLIAGLSDGENTRAERVGSLKANSFYLRWLLGLPALPMRRPPEQDIEPGLDAEVRKALAFALVEADRDRDYWIDSDHLLRGLMRFENSADFALLKTELSLYLAREGSKRDREAFPPVKNPNLKVTEYLLRKHFALWVPQIVSLACYLYILIQTFSVGLLHSAR